ncbi:MAG: DUF1697 domain-containing protein [Polyangia bacterium]
MSETAQTAQSSQTATPQCFIGLLRGINVGGHKQVKMAELRGLCERIGLTDVQSYIQSGNLIFRSAEPALTVEATLERAIADRFGFPVDVLVRAASGWPAILAGNPLRAESEREPNLVMLALAKRRPEPGAVAALRERAAAGERIEAAGEALWMHFPSGPGRSKLSPGLIDRLVGSPVTTRNFRTVQKLAELVGGG